MSDCAAVAVAVALAIKIHKRNAPSRSICRFFFTVTSQAMEIVRLDSRETSLVVELPDARVEGLGTGDVDIGGRVILERKRVDDLAASIRDGRWRDQLARLRGLAGTGDDGDVRVAVVVEGEIPPDDVKIHNVSGRSLRSALVGAFVRDGVPHFMTADVRGTADLVRTLAGRVTRDEAPSQQGGSSVCSGVRLPKRSEALEDTRAVAVAQLCVVPGVSRTIADRVLGECRTMGEWLARWSGREKELADLKVRTKRLGNIAKRLLHTCGATEYLTSARELEAQHDNTK